MIFEPFTVGAPLSAQRQREVRDANQRDIARVKGRGERFTEPEAQDNFVLFAHGPHAENITVQQPDGVIVGAPGASIASIVFNANTQVRGVVFTGDVYLLKDAVVVFADCRFESTVTVGPTSKAHFVGCVFHKRGFVDNQAALADAYIIGCHRLATLPHVNCTIIAETT